MLIWQGKCPVSDASQSAPQSQSDAIHQPARKCGESGCTENRVPPGTAPKKGLHATTSFSDNNSQTSSLQLCPALCPPRPSPLPEAASSVYSHRVKMQSHESRMGK